MQPLILLIVDSEWEQMIRPNNMHIVHTPKRLLLKFGIGMKNNQDKKKTGIYL